MSDVELILFAIANLVACTLSGAAGGGASLVAGAPLLVLLGMPPVQAIASMRFGGFGISLGTSSRFIKEKMVDKRLLVIFSVVGAFCSLIGSVAIVNLEGHTELLQKIMGLVILIVGIPALYFRKAGLKARPRSRKMKIVGLVLLAINVAFLAALGSGIGSLQMIILIYFFGMTALVASATRRAMQLTVTLVSLVVFIIAGVIDYKVGGIAFVTSFIGGYIGAHLAVKKGDKFVINLFAITSAVIALQLLLS